MHNYENSKYVYGSGHYMFSYYEISIRKLCTKLRVAKSYLPFKIKHNPSCTVTKRQIKDEFYEHIGFYY